MHNSSELNLIKAFNVNTWNFIIGIQNPYNSLINNIIFRDAQYLYSLVIDEENVSLIQQHTYNITWKLLFTNPHWLAISRHLNGLFVISVTDQMLYQENIAYGLDTIILITDFFLNTNSWIGFERYDGISFLIDENISKFLNPNTSINNIKKPPNVFYFLSLSQYNKNADPGDYIFRDVTEYIWPRYFWNDFGTWHFNLPVFMLNETTTISVGNNIKNKLLIFTPFSQWQNSQFVFTAIDNNTLVTPEFITIDLTSKTMILNISSIISVQTSFTIMFNAELIPFPNPDYTQFPHNYLTKDYSSTFEFINSPWLFISSNASYYLITDRITVFTFIFHDMEGDFININISQNNEISSYSQPIPNNSSLVNLILQANNVSLEPVKLVIQYTDSYHNDPIFYKSITLGLYLFSAEPPTFSQELPQINATRCKDYTVQLPSIVDVNNFTSTVNLIDSPSWVSLISNSLIYLNTTNMNQQISETTLVTIKITNSMNAWSKYNLIINVEPISIPTFGEISNISLTKNKTEKFKIESEGNSPAIAVDCLTKTQLSWASFNYSSSELIIDREKMNTESQWICLKTYDSWNREIYSNKFYVSLLNLTPLYIGNKLGPLKMFKGEKKLFKIPPDLFISSYPQTLKLSVNVVEWSTNSQVVTKIEFSVELNGYFLYANSNTSNIWQLQL